MSVRRCLARLSAFSLFLVAPTLAQNANNSLSSRPPTDSELIAGVREYPAEVLRALTELGQRPGLAKQLAENSDLLQNPEKISPAPSAELTNAVRTLARLPDAVAVAAAHPEALTQFSNLARNSAAGGVENRAARLQVAYRAEELRGIVNWQKALEGNPTALRQYRDVLNKFGEERRKQFAQFPVVTVTDERYYTAAPPSDLLLDFLNSNPPPAELDGVLLRWFSEHSAEAVDTAALPQIDGVGTPPAAPGELLALQPAEKRASMWSREVKAGTGVGLMPIVLQPEMDQPIDARVAHAIMEHDRMWSPLWTPTPGASAPLAQAAPNNAANPNVPPLVPVDNRPVAPVNPAPIAPPTVAADEGDGPVYSMVPVGSLQQSQPITAGSNFNVDADDEGDWVAFDDDVEVVVNVEDEQDVVVQPTVGYVAPETVVVDPLVAVPAATTVIVDNGWGGGWGGWGGWGLGGWGFGNVGWFGGGFCDPWWGGWGWRGWGGPVVCDPFFYSPVGFCYRQPIFGWGGVGGFGVPFNGVGRFYNGFWSPRFGVRSAFANGFVSGLGAGRFVNRFDGGVRQVGRGFRGRTPALAAGGVRQVGRGVRGTNNSFLTGNGLRRGDGNAFSTGVNGVRQTTRGLRGYSGGRGGNNNGLISPRSGGAQTPINNGGVRGLRQRGGDGSLGQGNAGGGRTLRRGGTQDMQPIGGGNSGPRGTVRGLRPSGGNSGGNSNTDGMRNLGRGRRSGDGISNLGGGNNGTPRNLSPQRGASPRGNIGNGGNNGGTIRGLRPQSGPRFEAGNVGGSSAPRRLNAGSIGRSGGDGARIAPRNLGGGSSGGRSFSAPRSSGSGLRSFSAPRSSIGGGSRSFSAPRGGGTSGGRSFGSGRSFGGGGGRSFGGGRGGVRGIR